MAVAGERNEGFAKGFARGGFDDELPGESAAGAFVEGRHRGRDVEFGVLTEKLMSLADFGESGFLGFIGDAEASKIRERRHLLLAAFVQEVFGEGRKIVLNGGLDDGMLGLVRLNEDFGNIEVAATDTAKDLGE